MVSGTAMGDIGSRSESPGPSAVGRAAVSLHPTGSPEFVLGRGVWSVKRGTMHAADGTSSLSEPLPPAP